MNKQVLQYVLYGVAALLVLQFLVVPLISRQKASQTIKTVLKSWKQNDAAKVNNFFSNPNKAPPIYNLESYEIKSHKFQSVNGKLTAKYWIVLNFTFNDVLPSGKTWICEMTIDKGNWKASDFYLAPDQ